MRKLNIKEDFRSNEIAAKLLIIEKKIREQLPNLFKDLLVMVEGSTIEENVFYDKNRNEFFPVHQFLEISILEKSADKIEKIYQDDSSSIRNENEELFFMPFAIDPGGWTYHISLAKNSYNEIWLNCFDNNEESPFNLIASSLEAFIEGLITEKEAIELGY